MSGRHHRLTADEAKAYVSKLRTILRFVGSCDVSDGGDVSVRLRLPTPQCAPNFAFLMVSDACEALRALPGVGAVGVVLEDHYTGAEINAAIRGGGDFAAAFPGETTGDLLKKASTAMAAPISTSR